MKNFNIQYIIEPGRKGFQTLAVVTKEGQKLYLHSKYDPLREADNYKQKFNPSRYDAVIILGLGLGYHLLPLTGILDKYKKIILIDILKNIESEIRKNKDLNRVLNDKRIILLTSQDSVTIENKISASAAVGFDLRTGYYGYPILASSSARFDLDVSVCREESFYYPLAEKALPDELFAAELFPIAHAVVGFLVQVVQYARSDV